MKSIEKKYFIKCFAFFFVLSFISKAQLTPAIEWRKTTWSPKGLNGLPQTPEHSGEDWWYSHKNVYNSQGLQTGYVTVGYTGLVSTISTFSAARLIYNEGNDSPYNPVTASHFKYDSMPDGCSDRDYLGEVRTPVRGNIGMNDLNGEMIYCKAKTIGALEEVIQDPSNPDFFYVVGMHEGVKPYNDKTNFILYNQSFANPNNNFSIPSLSVSPAYANKVGHMYVAKIHVDGTVIWQGLYGYPDYAFSPLIAYECSSYGYDIIKSSNGNLVAVGLAQISNSAKSAGHPFIVEIDPATGYLLRKEVLPVTRSGIVPITNNSNEQSSGGIAHSITEILSTGNYAIASAYYFDHSNFKDHNHAYIWNVDRSFNVSAAWASNPIQLAGIGPEYFNSNAWEIKYHKGLNQ